MYLRLILLAAIVYFASPKALAQEIESASIESSSEPEPITKKQSLAAHLGFTDQDVAFGQPRNFRAESLNNFGLDPITDEEP